MAVYTDSVYYFYNWLRPADSALMCKINCHVDYTVTYEGGPTCHIAATGYVDSIEEGPAFHHGGTFYNYVDCFIGDVQQNQLPNPPSGGAEPLPYPGLGRELISGYYKDGPSASYQTWTSHQEWDQEVGSGLIYVFSSWNSAWGDPSNYWSRAAAGNIQIQLDYRPSAVKYGNDWYSCNRVGGKSYIRQGGNWVETRTFGGGVDSGNPPLMRSNGEWKNQRKVGING